MTVGSEAVLLWYRQLAGATSATDEAELSESGKPPRPLAAAITHYQPRNQIDKFIVTNITSPISYCALS